ncbi:SulP family inorganic anion transporter [Patescibacteria group bacterium]|nr:SulP family inorganic anion transporter [Patescibacteria group bacterium]
METGLSFIKTKIKENWKSGLTTALVSIPLSISLAIASGASPMAGILTAVYAGTVAALFGGSNYNIVGPAGALSGILSAYAITKGTEYIPMLAVLTGILIGLFKLIKLEKYLVFVPESTIFGFTLGVAATIAINQVNFILGLRGLEKHDHLTQNLLESIMHIGQSNIVSVIAFTAFLAFMFLLLKKLPRLPGAIPVAILGIITGLLSKKEILPFNIDVLGDYYPNINAALALPFAFKIDADILSVAVTVAIVAIIETMISARVADGITKTRHNKEKEMWALGAANIVSGLFGGLPATAVFARTSINIKSGATHKASALINTVCVFMISFFLLPLFKFIPMGAIAAILVFAAIRMVETHKLNRLYKLDKRSFLIGLLVCGITVFGDAIYGILVGTILSLVIFVDKMTQGHFAATVSDHGGAITQLVEIDTEQAINAENFVYSIKGPLSYMNGMTHLERFEKGLNGYHHIFIRLKECSFIDIDGAEILDSIIESVKASGRSVALISDNPFINEQINILTKSARELKIYEKTRDAVPS